MFPIGKAAFLAGLPLKTVRYYDDINLVNACTTTEKGYRMYGEKELRKLTFVRHARLFGFSIDTCRELLDLYENPHRESHEVKDIAEKHLAVIRARIDEMEQLYRELARLTKSCHGDQHPDCPILEFMSAPDT